MAKVVALTCFEFVQQLKPEYFPAWSDEEREAVVKAAGGDKEPLICVMVERLRLAQMPILEAHMIVHDKDEREVWSETECKLVVEPKEVHVHFIAKSPDRFGPLDTIAAALGVPPQYIQKADRGRYGYDNLLAYLIHAKDEDKFQYNPGEVLSAVTAGGKGYDEYYQDRIGDWIKGRAAKKNKKAAESIEDLEERILTGQVTKSQVVLTDSLYDIYARYKRRCDDAFQVYGDRRAYKTLQALAAGEFRLGVFYVLGDPGAGKTRLAKAFVQELIRRSPEWTGEAWRVCQTAASNPMDEYNGEEILFMDDVRGSALSASDWLKLLDPYNASPASARYHNKTPACRAIVITSTKDPVEFFYYCKQMGGGDRSEALDQFMRRIQSLTRVIKAEDFQDTRAQIAECASSDPYRVALPDAKTSVELSYKFDFGDEMLSPDEAVERMVGMVADNQIKKQDQAGA